MFRLVFALLIGGASSAWAQPYLSRFPPDAVPSALPVRAWSGAASAAVRPASPVAAADAVLLLDTLSAEDLDAAKTRLLEWHRDWKGKAALKLVLRAGESFQQAGPFATRAKLQAALKEITAAPPAAPVSAAALTEQVARTPLTGGWSLAVFIGRIPAFDPELNDYAAAYLLREFGKQQVRLAFWNLAGAAPVALEKAAALTAGPSNMEDLAAAFDTANLFEWNWEDAPVRAGFHLYKATASEEIPRLVVAADGVLPKPEAYIERLPPLRALRAFAAKPEAANAAAFRASLASLLALNPGDADALRAGAAGLAAIGDHRAAVAALDSLSDLDRTPEVAASLGIEWFAAGELAKAEPALLKAAAPEGRVTPRAALVFDHLARIRMASKDWQAAVRYWDRSLAAEPKSQDRWLLRASAAENRADWAKAEESLERVLEIDRGRTVERTRLVRLYLDHGPKDRAAAHVDFVAANPPSNAEVLRTYAGFLEALTQPDRALALWKKAAAADPQSEPAHHAVSRLLLDRQDYAAALDASNAGLRVASNSARLHLAKSSALDGLNRFYEVRRHLRRASAGSNDAALLSRAAAVEDTFGAGAVPLYSKLAKDPAAAARGLTVALREGDLEAAKAFAPEAAKDRAAAESRPFILVPGGAHALAFMAHGKAESSPDEFFADFCRTVVNFSMQTDQKRFHQYAELVRDHFQRVAGLMAMGKRTAKGFEVTLASGDKNTRKATERALNLLGWKMRSSKQGVTLEGGEKASQAKAQETASALAIDLVAMQEALESGKTFSLEIVTDRIYSPVGEKVLKEQFFPKENFPGGVAEAMLKNPRLAQLLSGLSSLKPDAIDALAAGAGWKDMAGKHYDLISLYAPAFTIENGVAAVPGGEKARVLWQHITGVDPAKPAVFFKALLDKDNGKLLSYFSTLAELDPAHQHFFTVNESRTRKFYELYRDSQDVKGGADKMTRSNFFAEFLRQIPLTESGEVVFPGSPEVWMVAKGQSSSVAKTMRMRKKLTKVAAPDVEDEILIRLARTDYKVGAESHKQIENLLAVARIDERREDPLDDATALLLAQQYPRHSALYPWLVHLSALTAADYQAFFHAAEKLTTLKDEQLNTALGLFNSLIEIVWQAHDGGRLNEAGARTAFRMICDGFRAATDRASLVRTASATVRTVIELSGAGPGAPAEAMREILSGKSAPVTVEIAGEARTFDPPATRNDNIRKVLERQKVPPLDAILAIAVSLTELGSGKSKAPAVLAVLEKSIPRIEGVSVPKTLKLEGKQKSLVESFDPAPLAKRLQKMKQLAAKKKPDQKELQKIAEALLEELEPQTLLCLAGHVYASYFQPDDALITDDPLLLRKHQFLDLDTAFRGATVFFGSELKVSGAKGGSYFTGGFAQFAVEAAHAALNAGSAPNANTEALATAQLGAIRATRWDLLHDEDLRLAGLRIRLGREAVARAVAEPAAQSAVAEGVSGILSLVRRGSLISALQAGDWVAIWRTLTLSDLYFLGARLEQSKPALLRSSPVFRELARVSALNDGARLDLLGNLVTGRLSGNRPSLEPAPPYEEYERILFPTPMAQRAAEFKLSLAEYWDRESRPAAALGAFAEPAFRRMMQRLNMADPRDWRSAMAAFRVDNDPAVD